MKPYLLLAGILLAAACHPVPESQPVFTLDRVLQVEGRQGVAADSSYYYVSGSTVLYKYDKSGNLVASNEHPFDSLALTCNHIGDIDVESGEIYAGCEYFMDGVGKNIQVAVYDAETLMYKYSIPWEPASGQVECCGLAVDRDNGHVWMADWVNGSALYCYGLSSRKYLKKIELDPAPALQQGIFCRNGRMLISADDGDAEKKEPDHLYVCNLSDGKVSLLRTMDDFLLTGEIEGLCMDPATDELVVLSNRGARIILGMPRGFYPGYTEEIHNLYIYSSTAPAKVSGQ